ncbi:MAG: DNA polymerase III subunit delta [Prevotellaceae bacterium]|jgi:DNA polymerase-3 subunit delta'|nr:DNA polymerase III subunit delta [Prevotellaceae bacterium]
MLFSEIIGQKEIKKQLIQTASENRIPHAQLFRGPEGVGKLALAIAYAQYISCENKSADDSCGICPSCIKYGKLAHPDLHFVFPVIKPANKQTVVSDDFIGEFRQSVTLNPYLTIDEWYAKISDGKKQGMIYTHESGEIIRKLHLKTYEAEYKVMIIWYPEKMHESSANKILKILEEPPQKTVFLLVSNTPEEIITTILSRTQQVHIPKLDEEEIYNSLRTNLSKSDEEARYASRISNGSYSRAIRISDEKNQNLENFEQFVDLMRLAWKVGNKKDHSSLKTLKNWSDNMAAVGRERQKKFLEYAQRMIRENYILNLRQKDLNYMTVFEDNFSTNFSPFINERNVEEMTYEFSVAQRQTEQNVNAKMIFFDLTLKTIMLLKR